jgi:predicted O-methyltransferase YrrM
VYISSRTPTENKIEALSIYQEIVMRHQTPTKSLQYIRDLYAPEDALLQQVSAALRTINMQIQVGAEEGRFLQLLIRMSGVKKIIEVGTLAGYSTIWMARALPVDGSIITIEGEPKHSALAKGHFAVCEVGERIILKEGKAVSVLSEISGSGPFDMIFIDADKISYEKYLDWAEVNIRKGGLIVADNTLLFDSVYEDAPLEGISMEAWNTMRSFNQRLADKEKYLSVMLPTKEGLSIAVKQF